MGALSLGLPFGCHGLHAVWVFGGEIMQFVAISRQIVKFPLALWTFGDELPIFLYTQSLRGAKPLGQWAMQGVAIPPSWTQCLYSRKGVFETAAQALP